MKKSTLLLRLTLPLLTLTFIGCANKNMTINSTPQHQTTSPTIGTPISAPSLTKEPVVTVIPSKQPTPERRPEPTPTPTPTPTIITTPHQNAKNGMTTYHQQCKLPKKINESSGLLNIDNRLWTFNDSGGRAELYQISPKDGHIIKTIKIKNARNKDWEDIAYDDNYVYIGDIGNNRGNRKDLKVYKIPRAALRTQKSVRAEIIYFSFSDQKTFKSHPQKNNYDCEAMVAYHGKLYLFSKNWLNQKTRLYELSTQAGKHQAKYLTTFDIDGMVTGASLNKEMGILLLTTYSSLLNVDVWAFTNYKGHNFFNGDQKKLKLSTPLSGQIEGVTFNGNYQAYLSSEAFSKYIFSFDAILYQLDFSNEYN